MNDRSPRAPLSAHAVELKEALEGSEDALAIVPIPTAQFAAGVGVTAAMWMQHRAGLLLSLGDGIAELRAAGWTLDVHSLTGEHTLHEGAERVVVIAAQNLPQTPTPKE